MKQNLYCIEHEIMVEALPMKFCPFGHENFVTAQYDGAVVIENDFCCFESGFAFVPAPDEFYLAGHGDVLSPEEIEELNASAPELLTEWS